MRQSYDLIQGNDVENRKSELVCLGEETRKLTEFLLTWSKRN
jgi:hypothetical protein